MNYKNIIWVEDFDDSDTLDVIDDLDQENLNNFTSENLYAKTKIYFQETYTQFVEVKQNFKQALEEFENRFGEYDCVVLDVNLERGIKENEFDDIIEKLESNGMNVREISFKEFKKNAGYYLYLYLLRKGFPSDRVAMLTAYYGSLTNDWKTKFNNAGLKPPKPFDRKSIEDKIELNPEESFIGWLKTKMTPYYKLRSCVIAMSNIILEDLSEDIIVFNKRFLNAKINDPLTVEHFEDLLNNLKWLPLVTSKDNEGFIYDRLLSQLSHDWESAIVATYYSPSNREKGICINRKECVYHSFGYKRYIDGKHICNNCGANVNSCYNLRREKDKMICIERYKYKCPYAQNYKRYIYDGLYICEGSDECEFLDNNGLKRIQSDIAYNAVMKMLRNWIAHSKLDNVDVYTVAFIFGISMRSYFDIDKLQSEDYIKWEERLFELIEESYKNITVNNISLNKLIEDRIKKSCSNFYMLASKLNNFAYTPNISSIIHNIGGQQSKLKCDIRYILRLFGHCLFPIELKTYNEKNGEYVITLKVNTDFLKNEDSIDLKYFKAIFKLVFLDKYE